MARILVDKGRYIQAVNAAIIAGYSEFDVPHFLAFQLYEPDGSPSLGSYVGPGQVIERSGTKYLLLGDPYRHTQLPEYRIADQPEAESETNLDEFISGLKAALDKKRTKKNASSNWKEGFKEGKKLK